MQECGDCCPGSRNVAEGAGKDGAVRLGRGRGSGRPCALRPHFALLARRRVPKELFQPRSHRCAAPSGRGWELVERLKSLRVRGSFARSAAELVRCQGAVRDLRSLGELLRGGVIVQSRASLLVRRWWLEVPRTLLRACV